MKNVSTHKGACSSSVNLPQGACSQICNWFNIVEHLQDGHSPPEDKVYLWNCWYTEEPCSRSVPLEHAPGAKPLECIGLNKGFSTVMLILSKYALASSFKKEEPIAKVNPVGEIWWCSLELKTFQNWENFGWGSERIPITFPIITATSKVKLFKNLGAVGYLNTWLPCAIFICTNNTLLTEGCCKSELRYLKHWYRLLCPGLVKPILGHSFGRSWYMRLFHTPSTSFL